MSDDDPTTDDMREQYVAGAMATGFAYSRREAREDFDRWLAAHDAELREQIAADVAELRAQIADDVALEAVNNWRPATPAGPPRRVYISGPMTGLPDYNYPAFHAAADRLREYGYTPVSPTEIGQRAGWSWHDYMRAAVALQATCSGIHMLPGWSGSRGATVEWYVAQALGQTLVTLPDAVPELAGL